MSAAEPSSLASAPSSSWSDIVALGKPGITRMAVIVAAGTFLLTAVSGAGGLDVATLLRGAGGLLGVALIVMGAGAFNMLLESDIDARMERTRDRPLAAGRMASSTAFAVGCLWTLLSLPLLGLCGNALTVGLGVFSFFLYVFVYTPMKQRSVWSLVVGAVPGAMPALMGGTLVNGAVDVTGAALFGVVFLWQLPHFLAISIYREPEYVAAGHKVFPTSLGMFASKVAMLLTTLPLVVLGVALWPLGLGSAAYGAFAVVVGAWFVWVVGKGFLKNGDRKVDDAWAKKAFIGSLIWQTAVFFVLAVDRVVATVVA